MFRGENVSFRGCITIKMGVSRSTQGVSFRKACQYEGIACTLADLFKIVLGREKNHRRSSSPIGCGFRCYCALNLNGLKNAARYLDSRVSEIDWLFILNIWILRVFF